MDALRQPPPLVCSGNFEVNWTRFRQRLDIFMLATGFSSKKPAEKVALLLHVAGEEALEVYNTFKFSDGVPGRLRCGCEKVRGVLCPKEK